MDGLQPPQTQQVPQLGAAPMDMVSTNGNPLVQELASLSPPAQKALLDAHQQVVQHHVANLQAPQVAGQAQGGQKPGFDSQTLPNGTNIGSSTGLSPQHAYDWMQGQDKATQAPTLQSPSAGMDQGGAPGGLSPMQHSGAQLGATDAAQAEHDRLQRTGSGLDQIKSPWLRIPLKIGEGIVGSTGIGQALLHAMPGTDENHMRLVHDNQQELANDEGNDQKKAQTAGTLADTSRTQQATEEANALEPGKITAQGDTHDKDVADTAHLQQETSGQKLAQAPLSKDQADRMESLTGNKGLYKEGMAPQDVARTSDTLKQTMGSSEKQREFDLKQQEITTSHQDHEKDVALQRGIAATNHADHEKDFQLGLSDRQTARQEKLGEGTAAQKNRADLADNVDHGVNTIEAILNKPGQQATGLLNSWKNQGLHMIGREDPDWDTLQTTIHNISMAAQGAHGMRSAQALKDSADTFANSFKGGPDQIKASLEALRSSVQTFKDEIGRGDRVSGAGGAPRTDVPKVGESYKGHTFLGGDPSNPNSWKKNQ